MGKHSKILSKNRVINLDNDEMADPIKVVHDFFSASPEGLSDYFCILREHNILLALIKPTFTTPASTFSGTTITICKAIILSRKL